MSKLSTAIASYVRSHKAAVASSTTVLECLTADGVDVSNRKAVSTVVTPLVAAEYGVKLRKAERVTKNGDMMFPKSAEGHAAEVCRNRLLADIFASGAGHKPVDEFEIPADVRRAALAVLAAQQALDKACAGYEHSKALKAQALAAVKG